MFKFRLNCLTLGACLMWSHYIRLYWLNKILFFCHWMWCGVKMNESYLALILVLCRTWWLCRSRRWTCWWPLHHIGWSGKVYANSYFCWFYAYIYNLDGWAKELYALNVSCSVPLHLMLTTHLLSWCFIESALAQINVHKKKLIYFISTHLWHWWLFDSALVRRRL